MARYVSMPVPIKISIVTATRNRVGFLPRCIESVASQSYPHKEHIIIDGGSDDRTVELLQSYSEAHPHLRWISERDTGLSNALNKGLAMAEGDVIGVIGDDDSYAPDVFAIVAAEFEKDETVAIVSGNCEFVDNNGQVTATQRAGFTSRHDLIQCWRYWGKRVAIAAPSTFIRKSVIDEVGGFEESDRYAMDYRHWIKITEKFSNVLTVDRVFSKFRLDSGTISFSANAEQRQEMLAISREYWGPLSSMSYYGHLFSYLKYYLLPKSRDWILARGSAIKRQLFARRPASAS